MGLSNIIRRQKPESLSQNVPVFSPLQRDLNRLIDDFFSDFSLDAPELPTTFSTKLPAVNLSETEKEYKVSAELPGMKENDIEVSVADNTLTLRGEKKIEKEEKERGYVMMERSYGSFYRAIPLPAAIEEENITADMKDGILTVVIPKSTEAQKNTRKIQITKS